MCIFSPAVGAGVHNLTIAWLFCFSERVSFSHITADPHPGERFLWAAGAFPVPRADGSVCASLLCGSLIGSRVCVTVMLGQNRFLSAGYQRSQSPVRLSEWTDLFSERVCAVKVTEDRGYRTLSNCSPMPRALLHLLCAKCKCVSLTTMLSGKRLLSRRTALISKCQAASVCGPVRRSAVSSWWSLISHSWCQETSNERTDPVRSPACVCVCVSGSCYPCPEMVEVRCDCGSTVISVPCGREKSTKPPRCKELCRYARVFCPLLSCRMTS